MASAQTSLDAASVDRKARLAKLASLKRKQPGSDITVSTSDATPEDGTPRSETDVYLSGRNYDTATRGPKLGFETAPNADVATVEKAADLISQSTAAQALKDESEAEKGIDLFKLQPKKPNWDLKRDLAEKMKILDARTQNAIARLVRERIEKAKKEAMQKRNGSSTAAAGEDQGEELGLDGNSLVEGVHMREREEEEDERRERELDEED